MVNKSARHPWLPLGIALRLIPLGSVLSLTLGSAPSLAQLPPLPPQLPPAPPAPPASPPPTDPVPPASPTPDTSPTLDTDSGFLWSQVACPQDFDTVSTLLIRDIPSYTNRILQSSVADIPTDYRPTYVITASYPERMPLDITDQVYTTNADADESLHQLFFTTLERQYSGLEATSMEHYHWLFLTPGEEGWQMVFMFSVIGAEGDGQLPARDSSQGSVGQAVRRWLVDCQAGAIVVE